jgi:hypothetical protein
LLTFFDYFPRIQFFVEINKLGSFNYFSFYVCQLPCIKIFCSLSNNTNEFRKARTKDKFDLNEAREVKIANTKFKKIAS